MHKFDRIFERDHVNCLRLVNFVQQRRQRRRFAAAGRTSDEDQSRFFPGDFLKDGWKLK